MNKYERSQKKQKEVASIKCSFQLSNEQKYTKLDSDVVQQLIGILDNSGIIMNIDKKKGLLTIDVLESKYIRKNYRNAGRRERTATKKSDFMPYKYSDIVFMLEKMTDKAIMDKIGLAYATYYRHKKQMLSSEYYLALDKDKLGDLEYLKSVRGDRNF